MIPLVVRAIVDDGGIVEPERMRSFGRDGWRDQKSISATREIYFHREEQQISRLAVAFAAARSKRQLGWNAPRRG
jgi:hypothetical protein